MVQNQMSQSKISIENFPFYLCYGMLDDSSIESIEDGFIANYQMFGKKVMEVKITERYSEIQEFWDGKRLALSSYPTLKQSLLTHFSFINQKDSPIHLEWVKTITGLGNIYVDYIDLKNVKHLEFPAVFIHDIFIPLRLDDRLSLNKILSNEIVKVFNHSVSESMITWKSKLNGTIIQEKIVLIKIKSPTAFIHDILESINIYLYKEKMWRAIVALHSYSSAIGIKLFFGNASDEFCSFSILLNNESMKKSN